MTSGSLLKKTRAATKKRKEMDSKQGEDSTAKASILAVNSLIYQLQPDLSVAVSRTMVKQFPMAQKHTSRDSMIFTLNSGSAYLDFRDSYLSFDVKNISTGGTGGSAFFGTSGGSACSFFNRLTISSRSGQIIERCTQTHANMHSHPLTQDRPSKSIMRDTSQL